MSTPNTARVHRPRRLVMRSLKGSLCILIVHVLVGDASLCQSTRNPSNAQTPLVFQSGTERSDLGPEIVELLGISEINSADVSFLNAEAEESFRKGVHELKQGKVYDAIRNLRRAEKKEASPTILKLLAISYYAVHQYNLFQLKMQEAREALPDDFAPYYFLGRYYDSQLGNFGKAAAYFDGAIERQPEHLRSHYYLGYCHEAMRNLHQAEESYRSALEIAEAKNINFVLPFQGLARVRLLQAQATEALAFARRSVALAPQDPESHQVLARAYEMLGRSAEAAQQWQRVTALDKTDPTAYYRLSRSLRAVGRGEEAEAALVEYKRLSALYEAN